MPFEYPSNYYALRRVLNQRIRDKLVSLRVDVQEGAVVDKEEVTLELKIFAKELSTESGVPLKGVLRLFSDQGIHLEIKEAPRGAA